MADESPQVISNIGAQQIYDLIIENSRAHCELWQRLAQAVLCEVNAILMRLDFPAVAMPAPATEHSGDLIPRSKLVNQNKQQGLLNITSSGLCHRIKHNGFPKWKDKRGKEEYFSIAEINEWRRARGEPEL